MSDQMYGGNRIHSMDLTLPGRQDFASGPYTYFIHNAKAEEKIVVDALPSFSVYVFSADPAASVTLAETGEALQAGDMAQAENHPLTLRVKDGGAQILVAGVGHAVVKEASIKVTRQNDIKFVKKPWGFERWINGEHPGYAFKHICINPGFRTSLQYHHFKKETNVLMAGKAKCFFKKNAQVANDAVRDQDIGSFDMEAVSVMDVEPLVVHRIESLSHITLCEVSTPHLDDVVRISDDAKRGHGRIAQEHQ